MKQRIAEIITKFSTEGLAELRRAIRDTADDARRAQTSGSSTANSIRGIGNAAREARLHTRGLKSDLDFSSSAIVRSLTDVRVGVGGIARGFGDLSRSWKATNGSMIAEARRSVRDIGVSFGRLGAGLGRAGVSGIALISRAMGGLGRSASSAAAAVVSAFVGAGKTIAKVVFSEKGIIASAIGALGAAAYALITPTLGIGALGAAGLAGWWTLMDLKEVRQASEALGVPIDVVQQWQMFGNTVGVTTSELVGGMQTLQESITETLDPDPQNKKAAELRAIFRTIGLSTRDATGQMRPLSNVLLDLADITTRMNREQKNYVLTTLLGDAVVFSELMKTVGEDAATLNAQFEERKSRGLFATPEQIQTMLDFRVVAQDLFVTIKALARELFLTFILVFERFAGAFEQIFATPESRAGFIEKVFVKPFQKGLQWIVDFSNVFFSFDINKSLFGATSAGIVNTWMLTLRKWLWDIWSVGSGLVALLLGIGRGLLVAGQNFDSFLQTRTGFSIEEWLRGTGADDIESFFRDLGQVAAHAFAGAFDTNSLSTPFGRWIGGGLETLKAEIEPVRAYIGLAMHEIANAGQTGSGLEGVTTTLGQFGIMLGQTIGSIAAFSQAFYAVFFGSGDAPQGFEWLESVKSAFEFVRDVVIEIAGILGPLFSSFDQFTQSTTGMSGAASLVVGKLGLDLASKLASPAGVVAAGAVGGYAILDAIKDGFADWSTRNDTPEANAEREARDRDMMRYGPKPSAAADFARHSAAYDQRDRSLIAGLLADQEREMADQARRRATAPAKPGEAAIKSIDVVATGIPVILQLGALAQRGYNAIMAPDEADELQRALASGIGRR